MIHIIDYSNDKIEEFDGDSVEKCLPYKDKTSVTWINVGNIEDTDTIHAIVDNYYLILEKLEDILLIIPAKTALHRIHFLKRRILSLLRSSWPLREMITNFERSISELIHTSTHEYISDVYNLVIQRIFIRNAGHISFKWQQPNE